MSSGLVMELDHGWRPLHQCVHYFQKEADVCETETVSSNGIHNDILAWSDELTEWQRDALRRIVENGTLTEDDIDELAVACRHANGLDVDSVLELQPLAADHLPIRHQNTSKVTLCSVSDTENVNALDSKQSLSFAAKGLTVIFGYNGSGKSGYGRILRRVCRARSKGDAILPNVLADTPDGPASAVITYAIDDVEQPPEQWIDGQRSVDTLSSVSFFDSDCASVHVRGKNNIAFTPFGLDVLPALGTACKAVQTRLDSERKELESEVPQLLNSIHAKGKTKVGLTLKALKSSTLPEELDALASLSEAELQRMKEIPGQLAADPEMVAKELRTRAGRIDSLRNTIDGAANALSDEAVTAIKVAADDSATKARAALIAARMNFAEEPLTDIGEPVWRQLWDAARRYSAVSLPEKQFPVIDGADAVCVLCQQPLSEDAKDRLKRFEQFVSDDSAQQAAKARESLDHAVQNLENLGLLDEARKEQLKDIEACDKSMVTAVRLQLATLIRRLRAVKRAHKSEQWEFDVPGSLTDTHAGLVGLAAAVRTQAANAEKTADSAERKRLEDELTELKAREWLASVLGDVKEYVTRLAQLKKLKKAIKETRTSQVTTKSKELAKEYVTDQLRDAFATEIKKMQQGVRRLNVELVAAAGKFGSSYYRVQLVGASKADVGTIVSEGEHRCIALAGFLSELATEPCKSTVVFDDPVTSLDHHWRGCFARRLVEEAETRQVIVFTHDIVFLHDLCAGAEQSNVPIELRRVRSSRDSSGFVNDGLPWIAQKTSPRIDDLEKRARASRSSFDAGDDDKYERAIVDVYNDLRATIERAVEEKLFLGIVTRHQDYISLGNLKKVTAITVTHCERLKKLFKRCCDITSAHDRSSLRSFGVPTPDDAFDDIAELKLIIDDVKARQKTVV